MKFYKIYTRYKNEKAVFHGTIDFRSEFDANAYAYSKAIDVFSQHSYEELELLTYEDYINALFTYVDFWIEEEGVEPNEQVL